MVRATPPEHLVRCGGCGLVRREPPVSIERAKDIYDDEYYKQYESEDAMAGDVDGELRQHLKDRLAAVEKLVGVGRLVEIGCGKGYFMEYARRRGWRVSGVEVSEAAGNLARARGLDVHIGPVELMPPITDPVDFIHMNHVLEHVPDPVAVLRQVERMLAPNGVTIVEVPNEFNNLFFQLGRLVLPRRRLIYPIRSTHEVFFDPRSFRLAVAKSGLTAVRCRTVRWTIGERSGPLVRVAKRLVYMVERLLGRAGNIEGTLARVIEGDGQRSSRRSRSPKWA